MCRQSDGPLNTGLTSSRLLTPRTAITITTSPRMTSWPRYGQNNAATPLDVLLVAEQRKVKGYGIG